MTPKQFQLLSFIRNRIVHLGKGPTYREMKSFMKVGSNQAIDDLLTGLEKRRYIRRGGKMRGIDITKKGLGYKDIFILQSDKRLTSLRPPTYVSNVSVVEKYQVSFSKVTGVDALSFTPGELSQKGGEKDGNTTS